MNDWLLGVIVGIPFTLFAIVFVLSSFSKTHNFIKVRQVLLYANFPNFQRIVAIFSVTVVKLYVALGAAFAAMISMAFIPLPVHAYCHFFDCDSAVLLNHPQNQHLMVVALYTLAFIIWSWWYRFFVSKYHAYIQPPEWMVEPVITYSVDYDEQNVPTTKKILKRKNIESSKDRG